MRPDLDDPRRPAPADEAQGGLPLAQAIGTRNLIIIIVTMPLVFIFVVLGVIAIAGDPGKREARAAAAESAPAEIEQPARYRGALEPLQACLPQSGAPLMLPEGAQIGAMALDGDRLAIRIETDSGGEIVIYDLRAGAPLQTIPVRKEPGL